MNSVKLNDEICRICLKNDVFFDWTEAVYEYTGPSYKECYYQYTHLQEEDTDDLTQMLCQDCGNDLRNACQLVDKALESIETLKELKTNIKRRYAELNCDIDSTSIEDDKIERSNSTEMWSDHLENTSNQSSQYSELECTKKPDKICKAENKARPKKGHPLLCSHCSKIFYSPCHLRKHESIHNKNRERTEICPICGLKFYEKIALKSHISVHDENRERSYKCDYCNKAFFSRGSLNVHKRKHLGQMAKCMFCPKEFYRQSDLERHLPRHDVATLNYAVITTDDAKPKVKTKYVIECSYCDQQISRNSWEGHKAMHLNQPLVKCGICNKSYFNRTSVRRHIRRSHDVAKGEYDKIIISVYRKFKPRLSRLMKEQDIIDI